MPALNLRRLLPLHSVSLGECTPEQPHYLTFIIFYIFIVNDFTIDQLSNIRYIVHIKCRKTFEIIKLLLRRRRNSGWHCSNPSSWALENHIPLPEIHFLLNVLGHLLQPSWTWEDREQTQENNRSTCRGAILKSKKNRIHGISGSVTAFIWERNIFAQKTRKLRVTYLFFSWLCYLSLCLFLYAAAGLGGMCSRSGYAGVLSEASSEPVSTAVPQCSAAS